MDNTLATNLLQGTFSHPTTNVHLIETHLSWVILTGQYVYKIKKPINLDFVDFSTLEKRKLFCEIEIDKNQQLAAALELELVGITGSIEEPIICHPQVSDVIEYAVRMKQFSEDNLLSNLAKEKKLTTKMLLDISQQMANYHLQAEVAQDDFFGGFDSVKQVMLDNFTTCMQLHKDNVSELQQIKDWTLSKLEFLQQIIIERKQHNHIRKCHGDLHLGNMALVNNNVIIFDCIEFNEEFYWIDVINDIAFFTMDLHAANYANYAMEFLNKYLSITGDYSGVMLYQLYMVYRAMVRAKVGLLSNNTEAFLQYLSLSTKLIAKQPNSLYITCGLSGSGKSTTAKNYAKQLSAIIISSDKERKRKFADRDNLYTEEVTKQLYSYLLEVTNNLLSSGHNVIVDATFIKQQVRQEFIDLAQRLNVEFKILYCQANTKTLETRLNRRKLVNHPSDATVEVMYSQQDKFEPLNAQELEFTINLDTDSTKCS